MSGQAPRPLPSRLLVPVLGTVTYLACVIALFGFVSLGINRDVIDEADAGPLLGPAMVAAACVVTFVALARAVPDALPWRGAVAAAASAYVAMLVVGGIGYATTRGELLWVILFIARYAASPFMIGAALLSGGFVIAYWAVLYRSSVR